MRPILSDITYTCRVCSVVTHLDGMVYDSALGVCGNCAERISNYYHRQHSGEWYSPRSVTQADLEAFGDKPSALYPSRATPTKAKIKTAMRLRVYERDRFKCVYCGARKNLTLDHVRAESKGGPTEEGNLVTACKGCNSKKKTKTLAEFWEQRQ